MGLGLVPAAGAAQPAASSPGVLQVSVAEARREMVEQFLDAVGSLLADESVMVRPEIVGRIQSLHFREGERVRAGQLLVELNADEQAAALAQMEAQEALERQSLARLRDMRGKKLISEQLYDEALARWKDAGAQRERERVRLARTRIVAPFAGVIGLRRVSVGDYVAPGQDLVNLEAIDAIKLDFNVPEKYAALIRAGMKLTVAVDAWPDRNFEGAVLAIDPRVDEATRTLRLRARCPNSDHALKPGMFARVRLRVGERMEAVFVPEQALQAKGSQSFVYRIEDGKASATPVKTGRRRPGSVEIVEGLQGGERVVVEGLQKVMDGMAVSITPASGS
jgi:membrane fusion protein (multidrug efflux system)